MNRLLFLLMSVVIVVTYSCSSGKRLLENGQYDDAALTSINRLRQNPDNSKAKQTLRSAYTYALDFHRNNIKNAAVSSNPLKWETVVDNYSRLQNLSQEIRKCPACMKIIPQPDLFSSELNDSRTKAAEVRYALGSECMKFESKEKSKEAYRHFLLCQNFVPGFKDVSSLIEQSRIKATTTVVLEPIPMHSYQLKLSNEFFENKIRESMNHLPLGNFVRFYHPNEAELIGLKNPDQLIRLSFDDFFIGQTMIKETIIPCKNDSVEISRDSTGKPVFGTVTAELHQFKKIVVSSGLLDFKIVDVKTKATQTQDKISGSYNWSCEWGYYNGDRRALNPEQLNLTKNKELFPPAAQQLFVEFCKPIHEQVCEKIKSFYSNY